MDSLFYFLQRHVNLQLSQNNKFDYCLPNILKIYDLCYISHIHWMDEYRGLSPKSVPDGHVQ